MALRHALLAALLDGESSGYELAKRFDASVANFWHALPQQLYTELRRLEEQRLVSGRAVRQQGRPDKRVFAITPTGEDELRRFAAEPTRPGALKEDLAVKVYAAGVVDHEVLAAALDERAAHAAAKLERYQRQVAALADPDGADLGPSLTLARGSRTSARTSAGARGPPSGCERPEAEARPRAGQPPGQPRLRTRCSRR